MIKKQIVKSCCNKKSYIFHLESPIRKSHMEAFKNAGYGIPANFTRSGLFYIQKNGIIATASFGTRKINVRFSQSAEAEIKKLEEILDKLTSKP